MDGAGDGEGRAGAKTADLISVLGHGERGTFRSTMPAVGRYRSSVSPLLSRYFVV